jgi:hypothetical protein
LTIDAHRRGWGDDPLGKLVYKNEIKSKIREPLATPPQKKICININCSKKP